VGCQKSQRVSQQEVQEGEGNHPGSNQTFEEHLTAVEKNKQTNKTKNKKQKQKQSWRFTTHVCHSHQFSEFLNVSQNFL